MAKVIHIQSYCWIYSNNFATGIVLAALIDWADNFDYTYIHIEIDITVKRYSIIFVQIDILICLSHYHIIVDIPSTLHWFVVYMHVYIYI